eukprot:CAMPEP_0117436720 /NCGR_PEP_ID=MMETSP0759-20121206/1151_1 /TAXON_ID=63605 /ORGANISM="Percolomonas cosmopolitus, Strain WS" /LENGTH=201 /DNA_ID=CAMNT_0005228325 /DNA_START=179 /DNA_END=784 /DNA_ORIENTATION=+
MGMYDGKNCDTCLLGYEGDECNKLTAARLVAEAEERCDNKINNLHGKMEKELNELKSKIEELENRVDTKQTAEKWHTFSQPITITTGFDSIDKLELPSDVPRNAAKVRILFYVLTGNVSPQKKFFFRAYTQNSKMERFYHHSFGNQYNQDAISFDNFAWDFPVESTERFVFVETDISKQQNQFLQISVVGYSIRCDDENRV